MNDVFHWFQFGSLKEWLVREDTRLMLIKDYGIKSQEIDQIIDVIQKIEQGMENYD